MKKIQRLFISGIFAMMLVFSLGTQSVFAEEPEVVIGPFEKYLDCIGSCIERTQPRSLRRAACSADCYIVLVGDVVEAVIPLSK